MQNFIRNDLFGMIIVVFLIDKLYNFFTTMKPMFKCLTCCALAAVILFALPCALHAETSSSVLIKNGSTYQYGSQSMDKAAYRLFLQNECPKAYQQYKQGQECMIAGWTLFGVGLVGAPFSAVGMFTAAYGMSASPTPSANAVTMRNLSITALALSGAMVVASVPLLSVGYHLMDKSVSTFNGHCNQTPGKLTLQMTGSSLGIALSF